RSAQRVRALRYRFGESRQCQPSEGLARGIQQADARELRRRGEKITIPASACPAKVGTGFPPARSPGIVLSCGPMLRRAKAGAKRTCADEESERDDESKKRHPAL